MPDKIIQSNEVAAAVLGFIGTCLVAVAGLVGIKIRADIKKSEKQQDEIDKAKETNEKDYRDKIESTHKAMWEKIDESRDDIVEIGKQLSSIVGRFEDLQRAHFEATCKNLMKKSK